MSGWISAARAVPSPNWDERPPGTPIDLLVIHNISLPPGEFGGPWIERLFLNCLDPGQHCYFSEIAHLRVSSHLLIRRDGELIQFVALDKRAWHAGESCFLERTNCNDFSIGIELEGCDDKPFTQHQYQTLASTTREIQSLHPAISEDRIVGHSEIAPHRKTDPGPCFDWGKYKALLKS